MAHKVIYMKDGGLWAALLCRDEELVALEKSGAKVKWHDLWIEGEHHALARLFFEDGSRFGFDFQNIGAGRPALLTLEKKVHHIMPAEAKEWQTERIIFLDLDGVLNSATELFDSRCVENLSKLIAWTGAKIVISSSWRMYGEDYVRELWKEKKLPGEIVGVTPMINLPADGKARGHEIAAYVDSQRVTNYVIIDDDNEMLPEQQSRLVLTDGMTGLTEADIFKAIKIMKTEIYKEKKWKSDARIHQSKFRENELRCECGPNPGRNGVKHYYGNILEESAAREGLNFVGCYRDEIRKAMCGERARRFPNTSLTNNLLRSEHIPYNLFLPMSLNREAMAELLQRILQPRIKGFQISQITDFKIEWPTVSRSESNPWTGDHTAFDVYVQYKDEAGRDCGIGIEIKYTEEGYKIGEGEKERLANVLSDYHLVTEHSGCFNIGEGGVHQFVNDPEGIRNDHFRQMWRNHILGLAMTQKEVNGFRLHNFISLHLYPEWNVHFHGVTTGDGQETSGGAVAGYKKLLTEKGKQTFSAVTYEDLFREMKPIVFDPERDAEWKEYFASRYLINDK